MAARSHRLSSLDQRNHAAADAGFDRHSLLPALHAALSDSVLARRCANRRSAASVDGLGYYARARNLHRAAIVVRDELRWRVSTELRGRIGITGHRAFDSGAILALSTDARYPILDGNVKRVLSRVFLIDGDPSAKKTIDDLWALAEACTPQRDLATYTQAIMDLGATLCTRSKPACVLCR